MATPTPAAKKPPARKLPAKAAAPTKKVVAAAISKADTEDLLPDLEDNTTYKKAEQALQAAGLSLGQVLQELIPNEADEENILRLPVRPTLRQVRLDKVVVVMVEYDSVFSTDFAKPIDRDSEGFDDLDDAKAYFDINVNFAKGDVKGAEDARHIVVLIPNTEDLMDFSYEVIVPDRDAEAKEWKKAVEALLDSQEHDFIFSGKTDSLRAAKVAKAIEKGDIKVKGLQRSKNAPGAKPVPDPKRPAIKSSNAPKKPVAVKNPPPVKRTIEDIAADMEASRQRRGVDRQGRVIQQQEAQAPVKKARKAPANPTPPAIVAKQLPKVAKAAAPKAAPIVKNVEKAS